MSAHARAHRRRRPHVPICLVVVAALAAALTPGIRGDAAAHDSSAPPGEAHTWLPAEDWVGHHWVPFDEQTLKRALGLRGRDLEAYLYDDHRTLAQLAALRGIDVDRLADDLIDPWRGRVDDRRLAVLRERTFRLLSQAHLAQHVFFHRFHISGAVAFASSLLGVPVDEYSALRARGLTPLQIARRRGIAESALEQGFARLLQYDHDAGVRLGESSPTEAARILARQRAALPCWLRRPHPRLDPSNPYGKALMQHGVHGAGWPATRTQRRADEARVERVRRSLPRSCWHPPPRWSWSGHGLASPDGD